MNETERDAARYRWLRNILSTAKGGAGVQVNEALGVYEKPKAGEEVRLYWYPATPVGFNEILASSLDDAVDEGLRNHPEEPPR
jgi:hypothetical protein